MYVKFIPKKDIIMPINHDRIKKLALSKTGFLFDPIAGHTFTLNKTATYILTLLQEGKKIDEVKKDVLSKFEVTQEQIEKDLEDFTEQLEEFKLLE